jgi:site-specific DNA recombinase
MQNSLDDQLRVCREAAAKRNLVLADEDIFYDRETGQLASRPGWEAVKARVQAGNIRAVIGFSLSRMFRNLSEALTFWDVVRRYNITLVLASENEELCDDDRSEQFFQMRAMIDEWYARSLSNHIRTAQETLLLGRFVFGTITYGYRGEPVAGVETKSGRQRCRLVIDQEEATWVRTIFKWFTEERRPIVRIVKDLNACGAPVRGNRRVHCWSYAIVRRMLGNPRYRGDWSYGDTKAVIVDRRYKCGVKREKPLRTVHYDELCIIDDVQWAAAQKQLANYRERVGRRAKVSNKKKHPRCLSPLFRCEVHRVPLVVTGTSGIYQTCPECKKKREPDLVSILHREKAQMMVCNKLAELIQGSSELVELTVAECQAQARDMQQPDTSRLDQLQRARQKLTDRIEFILANSGETAVDKAESARAVKDARGRRADLDLELETLKMAMRQPLRVPKVGEVKALMQELTEILVRGALSAEPQDAADVYRVVTALTGGEILVSQAGERKRQRGWPRLKMRSGLLPYLLGHFGAQVNEDAVDEITIDLRRPLRHEQIADKVKELYDQNWTMARIAKKLGVGNYTLTKALRHWYHSRGLPGPDHRGRHERLKQGPVHKFEQIAEAVGRLAEDDSLLIEDIAKRVGADRNTVTKALNYWRQQHGLPKLDFRHRRKSVMAQRRSERRDDDASSKQRRPAAMA